MHQNGVGKAIAPIVVACIEMVAYLFTTSSLYCQTSQEEMNGKTKSDFVNLRMPIILTGELPVPIEE